MAFLTSHAGGSSVNWARGLGTRALLWAVFSGLMIGPAPAASFSYEKNVVKLLQKNPVLAPEIVEGLKDCRLVTGMTEEQAMLVGKRSTRLTPRPGQSGGLSTGIVRVATKDDQGRKVVEVFFYMQNRLDLGPSADGGFQWQKQGGQRVIILEMRFLDGELAGWGAHVELGRAERARIRQEIENRLAKSEITK
jgi:hypothetical protein